MRIEKEKATLKGLSLGSINNIFALPKKESNTDLQKQGLWQEEAISNCCVIPKEIGTRELQHAHETLKGTEEVTLEDEKFNNNETEKETRTKKCRWNDYVGTILATGSEFVVVPIGMATEIVAMLIDNIAGVGRYIALPWMRLSMGIILLPAALIKKIFRVDEECAETIIKKIFRVDEECAETITESFVKNHAR